MAEGPKAQIVSFGEDSGPLIVQRGGIRVQFNSSGVDVFTNLPVVVHPAANDSGKSGTLAPAEGKAGDWMPDGSVYAGISPDTGKAM